MEIAFIIIGSIVLLIGLFSVKVIPESKIAIVERLGAYHRIINTPGVLFIFPNVERVFLIDRITTLEARGSEISINGKKDFEANFDIIFEVIDPKLYYYHQKDPKHSLKDICLKEIRIYLSEHPIYDILETKKELKEHLIDFIGGLEGSYHIKLKSFDLISLIKTNENI